MQKSTAYGSWDDEPFFTFDGFSKDKTRALFKFAHLKHPKETVFRRLHEKQLVGSPVFSIQVREVVNDTGVPDLQIDDEKKEISFHWKEMFDQLLGEEHVFNTILSQRLGWHLDPGEETPDLLDTHRKLARRSRLQRECRSKYGSNILDHYMHEETQALEELQRLRLAASRSDDTNSGEHNHNNLTVYTKQQIADELPNGAIIYSGNFNAGPNPGSIPRGIFTNRDYCWPGRSYTLPPPSAADLFSPRPMPILSRGRERIGPARKPRKPKGAREGDEGYVITPVVTPIEERMSFLQPTASPP